MAFNQREYNINYQRELRVSCKRLHICVQCYKQDAYTLVGRTLCADCAAKDAARHRQKYSLKEEAEKRKEERRLKRQRHIENHECTECGKKLPQNYTYRLCARCRGRKRRRWKKKDMRGVDGMCSRCGKELCMEGKRLCAKCYEKQLPIAQKGLAAIDMVNHPWRRPNNTSRKNYDGKTDKK